MTPKWCPVKWAASGDESPDACFKTNKTNKGKHMRGRANSQQKRFERISRGAYQRLLKTTEYKTAANDLMAKGYSQQRIQSALRSEVVNGRFLDFDDFSRRLERGKIKG